jgi:hypothetical protein
MTTIATMDSTEFFNAVNKDGKFLINVRSTVCQHFLTRQNRVELKRLGVPIGEYKLRMIDIDMGYTYVSFQISNADQLASLISIVKKFDQSNTKLMIGVHPLTQEHVRWWSKYFEYV